MASIISKTHKIFATLGVFSLMMALAATLTVGRASAASLTSDPIDQGYLTVQVSDLQSNSSLVGAQVEVLNNDTQRREVVAKGVTNKIGAVTFTVRAGAYIVNVAAQGYKATSVAAKVNATTETNTQVGLAKVVETGTLVLRVKDGAGKAGLVGAAVMIFDMKGEILYKGTTGKGGTYSIELPNGSYAVTIKAAGYNSYSTKVQVAANEASVVTVNLTRPANH